MKTKHCTYLIFLALSACAIHTSVGPKPDIRPAMTENKATQKSITEFRTQVKGAQINLKTGATALDVVDQYLKLLLNLPPKEQHIVVLAQAELHRGMSEFASAAAKIAVADARASDALLHAQVTGTALSALGSQIEAAYKREKILAADNAKMLPVYKECTAYWDLGSGWYFIRHLIKHLLILAAVAVGLFAILAGLSAFGVPGLGFALSFAKRILSGASNTASSLSNRAVDAARRRIPPW